MYKFDISNIWPLTYLAFYLYILYFHSILFEKIFIGAKIIRSHFGSSFIKQKKLPKWLQNICTNKYVFSNKNITSKTYDTYGLYENIYTYSKDVERLQCSTHLHRYLRWLSALTCSRIKWRNTKVIVVKKMGNLVT